MIGLLPCPELNMIYQILPGDDPELMTAAEYGSKTSGKFTGSLAVFYVFYVFNGVSV